MSEKQPASVKIMDREYKIACTNEERAQLMAAADYVDEQMRALRASGNIVGAEKVAVITALNIANDFLQSQAREQQIGSNVGERLHALRARLDAALDD